MLRLPALPDRGPLHERNFRLLWIGRSTSMFGDFMGFVALAFAVLAITGSGTNLGLVIGAFSISNVTFLLIGGVVADRVPRRTVMVAADVVRGVAQASLAIAVLTDTASLPVFLLVAIASGSATGFFQPAATGLIPLAISRERLQQGNALLNLSGSASQLMAPVLSGLIVVAIGPGVVFAFDAVTFAVSAVALASLRLPAAPAAEHGSFFGDLADGWREVLRHRWLPPTLVASTFMNFAFAGFLVLGPIAMAASYGGAQAWGFVVASFGLGGLIGGAVAMRWKPARPMLVIFPFFALLPMRLVALSITPPLAAVLGVVLVASVALTFADTLWHTTLQQQVPANRLSRVSSFDWMVSLLFFPVGAAVAGPLADAFGPSAAMQIYAVLGIVPCMLVLAFPSVRAVRRRDAPPEDASAAAPAATECEEPLPQAA
ncbi:MAG TPA: MFS transporter [Candidatus Limnocylindrales bacterium]|nr:MFS transporter [Candidatus Limnocylindrales bacterium]